MASAILSAVSAYSFSNPSNSREVVGTACCMLAGSEGFLSQKLPILTGLASKGSIPG